MEKGVDVLGTLRELFLAFLGNNEPEEENIPICNEDEYDRDGYNDMGYDREGTNYDGHNIWKD